MLLLFFFFFCSEPLKRKVKSQADSDDDDFLDRTGDIERKKLRKSNPTTNVALTYEDLVRNTHLHLFFSRPILSKNKHISFNFS